MANEPKGSHVYQNSQFLKLWIAQAISQTAQNATFFALIVYVEQKTRSSSHVGALIISTILPAVLFGVAAGVFVDRWNKRTVLVATNALRAVAVLGYLWAGDTFVIFYSINFVFSTISQFFLPAEAATIPLLVRKDQLIAANGLFNITFTMSQLAGFVILGPPLIKAFGAENLLVGISVSYVLCSVLVARLPADKRASVPSTQGLTSGIASEVAAGWRLLRGDRAIGLAMLNLTLVTTMTLVLGELGPGLANRVLGMRAEDSVFLFLPAGLGILGGTVLLSRLVARFRLLSVVNSGLILFGVGMILIAAVPAIDSFVTNEPLSLGLADLVGVLGILLVLSLMMGVALAMVNVTSQTILQERAPADMRGRVFAIQLMFGSLASIVPLVFFGQLADHFGVLQVLALIGLSVLGAGYYSIVQTRAIRRLADNESRVETS